MRAWGYVACLYITGCGILGPNVDTLNLVPLEPIPSEYKGWYEAVQVCVGRRGDFDAIVWFVADELFLGGVEKGGVWSSPDRIIMRADQVLIMGAVKHEMIHHIFQLVDELHGSTLMDRCSHQAT